MGGLVLHIHQKFQELGLAIYNYSMTNKSLGDKGEQKACSVLEQRGYKIIDRNCNFREGEIDIVAEKDNKLLFVEVKTRKSKLFGDGIEAMNLQKVRKMRRAIFKWREKNSDFREGALYFIGIFEERNKTKIQGNLIDI